MQLNVESRGLKTRIKILGEPTGLETTKSQTRFGFSIFGGSNPDRNVTSITHFIGRIALFPLLVAGLTAAENSSGLPKNSPFELRGGPSAPAATASETLEFAGVSAILGKKPDLIIYDKTAKKSHWIAQGETKEGIAVINYDERREEAVVKVNGVQKTLALRKATAPTGARPVATTRPNPAGFITPLPGPTSNPVNSANAAPAPAAPSESATPNASNPPAAAPAPQPGTPAEIQTRQETEARMLVSDLLEIGMAQRRAYEEAQRKAAGGNTPAPAASETPHVVPAQPNPPVQ